MRTNTRSLLILTIIAVSLTRVFAQSQAEKEAQAEKAFDKANALLELRKAGEALVHYKQALAILPNDPAILFNTGMAAFQAKDYAFAADVWKQLKTLEPLDWHARAKLVQVYQTLDKRAERDKERTELLEMWKSAKTGELKEQVEYCRDQFEVQGLKVMAFERYELKGERALRYVFSILNKTEDGEEFRISLGSYDFTNAFWRSTKKPPPKDDERLFHLDGYFKNGSHATYGMYFPEPSYDDVRVRVIEILEAKVNPISTTIVPSREPKQTPTPKPE